MKLIIAGSTGTLATELIRQALSNTDITTLIALGRRETIIPSSLLPNANPSKLKSVILADFENYTEDVKEALAGADAVIWTIAIVPIKLKTVDWEQTCKISRDYALKGIEMISHLPREGKKNPLRFIYMSGYGSVRDQSSKKPLFYGDYSLMRGDAEARILAYAKQSEGAVEACVAQPGVITDSLRDGLYKNVRVFTAGLVGVPKIDIKVISAGLLKQVVGGFEKETLVNEDLIRIGALG